MGAPNVSSAILTTSIARTTPAQKPRGFNSRTRFSATTEPASAPAENVSEVVAVTMTKYTVLPGLKTVAVVGSLQPRRPLPILCLSRADQAPSKVREPAAALLRATRITRNPRRPPFGRLARDERSNYRPHVQGKCQSISVTTAPHYPALSVPAGTGQPSPASRSYTYGVRSPPNTYRRLPSTHRQPTFQSILRANLASECGSQKVGRPKLWKIIAPKLSLSLSRKMNQQHGTRIKSPF